MTRVACKIHNRFFQICLYFCWCPSSLNSSNNFMHIGAVSKIRYRPHMTAHVCWVEVKNKKQLKEKKIKKYTCNTHPFMEPKKHNRLERRQSKMDFCIRSNLIQLLLRWMQHASLFGIKITGANGTILHNGV